jgi:membrane protein DedA with SNARE-associated domain
VTRKRRALLILACAVALQAPWLVCGLVGLKAHSFFWTLLAGLFLLVGSPLFMLGASLGRWPAIRSDVLGFGSIALAGVGFWFAVGLVFWFRDSAESH